MRGAGEERGISEPAPKECDLGCTGLPAQAVYWTLGPHLRSVEQPVLDSRPARDSRPMSKCVSAKKVSANKVHSKVVYSHTVGVMVVLQVRLLLLVRLVRLVRLPPAPRQWRRPRSLALP